MTVREAVTAGQARLAAAWVPAPGREARLLLSATAGVDARLDPDRELPVPAVVAYGRALDRRCRREPFAYITGWREFYGLPLHVDPRVLIPRPETELLVERALARAPLNPVVADLCTGSGAVALAVAAQRPDARVIATDLSAAALQVAEGNAARLGLPCRFLAGDLWCALPADLRRSLDVCTCNPPYVDAGDLGALQPEVRDWEPRAALVPPDGWAALQARLAAGAAEWLRPGGWLLTEVGAGQAGTVTEILRRHGLAEVAAWPDLGGVERVVEGRCPL